MNNMDEKYMQTALKLAARGIGSVEPNPAVGCVIVKSVQIIGKGWHRKFGESHAEINALEDCKTLAADPAGSTIYITLEPCSHQGRTPPCTDAIIAAGPARVVIAALDPSPHANGKGVELLRRAGIEVQVGLCEQQARLLNAPFFKFIETERPWVILKWAQSIDGKAAYADTTQRWVSNELSRSDAHKLRHRVGGVLVGINTVLADDPSLTVRPRTRRQPLRIILDSRLRIPIGSKLFRAAKKAPVMIVSSRRAVEENSATVARINKKGAEVLALPAYSGRCEINLLLDELGRRRVAQLLVEGGPKVIASFLKERLVDEICVYITPKLLGAEGTADISEALAELTEIVGLDNVSIKQFGNDVRLSGLVKRQGRQPSSVNQQPQAGSEFKEIPDEENRGIGPAEYSGN
jgi:diaminohydroxyphosphoribosylaminopyrimidine deaminase/5-amino-6-(5-phosphoribosylamino)uracil reductase